MGGREGRGAARLLECFILLSFRGVEGEGKEGESVFILKSFCYCLGVCGKGARGGALLLERFHFTIPFLRFWAVEGGGKEGGGGTPLLSVFVLKSFCYLLGCAGKVGEGESFFSLCYRFLSFWGWGKVGGRKGVEEHLCWSVFIFNCFGGEQKEAGKGHTPPPARFPSPLAASFPHPKKTKHDKRNDTTMTKQR